MPFNQQTISLSTKPVGRSRTLAKQLVIKVRKAIGSNILFFCKRKSFLESHLTHFSLVFRIEVDWEIYFVTRDLESTDLLSERTVKKSLVQAESQSYHLCISYFCVFLGRFRPLSYIFLFFFNVP